MFDGQSFCSVVEAKDAKYPDYNPIELDYTFKTRKELEHAFSVLKAKGTVNWIYVNYPGALAQQ